MFQCYSLKSSHPCLLPQSPKVCSSHLCLYCCPACEMKWSEVAQSCPTLCNPMDWSPPDSSVHGIFQARVPEQVAISFSIKVSDLGQMTWASELPSHPGYHKTLSRVSVLSSRYLLVIHFKYSSVYMTIPNSLTIFSLLPSLTVSVNKFICIFSFWIPHIQDITQYFSFSVWLTSLSVTVSRSSFFKGCTC